MIIQLQPLWTPICTKLFNLLADILAWIAQNAGASYLIHYLDNYLTMGLPASTVYQHNVDTIVSLCAELGVSTATDKLEGPSTSLSFLGIISSTNHMEIRLPPDKLARIQELLKHCFPGKSVTRDRFYHQQVVSNTPQTNADQQILCLKYPSLVRCTTSLG